MKLSWNPRHRHLSVWRRKEFCSSGVKILCIPHQRWVCTFPLCHCSGFLFPGVFLHGWQRDPHGRPVPGRLEAERPRHHAEVPPHEGEPALGVRCRGRRGGGGSARLAGHRSLRAGRSFPMEHGRTAGPPASAGAWWHHVPMASPARARTWESTAIQLTDGFYTVFPQSFLFRGVKKSFVVQKR